MFVDKERISIKSGNGGDGMTSFMTFAGVANGGPDGGDGGNGGHVYFIGNRHKTSLIEFHYKHKYMATDGGRGDTNNCHGKNGEDIIIPVPLGTVIRDEESGNIICDIFNDGQKELILQGGNGGKGNVHFCTSRRHTPHFAQKGEKTEIRRIVLELKVIADVGLIGFPNVGKSTMLSKISGAKPKIANYHFTTLSPNLGVVSHYDETFVVADIPGLIEGASQGAGLGTAFLRHVERTRMLVHVIDVSGVEGRDPFEDYIQINRELKEYSNELSSRPQVIVLNKSDMYGAEENIVKFKEQLKEDYPVFTISAILNKGLKEVINSVFEILKILPKPQPIEHEPFKYEKLDTRKFEVVKPEGEEGLYIIEGPLVQLLERNVVLDDVDSLAYMQKTLRQLNVIKQLRRMGAKDGDTVIIGEIEFDFID